MMDSDRESDSPGSRGSSCDAGGSAGDESYMHDFQPLAAQPVSTRSLPAKDAAQPITVQSPPDLIEFSELEDYPSLEQLPLEQSPSQGDLSSEESPPHVRLLKAAASHKSPSGESFALPQVGFEDSMDMPGLSPTTGVYSKTLLPHEESKSSEDTIVEEGMRSLDGSNQRDPDGFSIEGGSLSQHTMSSVSLPQHSKSDHSSLSQHTMSSHSTLSHPGVEERTLLADQPDLSAYPLPEEDEGASAAVDQVSRILEMLGPRPSVTGQETFATSSKSEESVRGGSLEREPSGGMSRISLLSAESSSRIHGISQMNLESIESQDSLAQRVKDLLGDSSQVGFTLSGLDTRHSAAGRSDDGTASKTGASEKSDRHIEFDVDVVSSSQSNDAVNIHDSIAGRKPLSQSTPYVDLPVDPLTQIKLPTPQVQEQQEQQPSRVLNGQTRENRTKHQLAGNSAPKPPDVFFKRQAWSAFPQPSQETHSQISQDSLNPSQEPQRKYLSEDIQRFPPLGLVELEAGPHSQEAMSKQFQVEGEKKDSVGKRLSNGKISPRDSQPSAKKPRSEEDGASIIQSKDLQPDSARTSRSTSSYIRGMNLESIDSEDSIADRVRYLLGGGSPGSSEHQLSARSEASSYGLPREIQRTSSTPGYGRVYGTQALVTDGHTLGVGASPGDISTQQVILPRSQEHPLKRSSYEEFWIETDRPMSANGSPSKPVGLTSSQRSASDSELHISPRGGRKSRREKYEEVRSQARLSRAADLSSSADIQVGGGNRESGTGQQGPDDEASRLTDLPFSLYTKPYQFDPAAPLRENTSHEGGASTFVAPSFEQDQQEMSRVSGHTHYTVDTLSQSVSLPIGSVHSPNTTGLTEPSRLHSVDNADDKQDLTLQLENEQSEGESAAQTARTENSGFTARTQNGALTGRTLSPASSRDSLSQQVYDILTSPSYLDRYSNTDGPTSPLLTDPSYRMDLQARLGLGREDGIEFSRGPSAAELHEKTRQLLEQYDKEMAERKSFESDSVPPARQSSSSQHADRRSLENRSRVSRSDQKPQDIGRTSVENRSRLSGVDRPQHTDRASVENRSRLSGLERQQYTVENMTGLSGVDKPQYPDMVTVENWSRLSGLDKPQHTDRTSVENMTSLSGVDRPRHPDRTSVENVSEVSGVDKPQYTNRTTEEHWSGLDKPQHIDRTSVENMTSLSGADRPQHPDRTSVENRSIEHEGRYSRESQRSVRVSAISVGEEREEPFQATEGNVIPRMFERREAMDQKDEEPVSARSRTTEDEVYTSRSRGSVMSQIVSPRRAPSQTSSVSQLDTARTTDTMDSLAYKVRHLLERESPERRVDAILKEAEMVEQTAITEALLEEAERREQALSGSPTRIYDIQRSQRTSEGMMSSRSSVSSRLSVESATFAPIGLPFTAFDFARNLITNQLNKVAENKFDHSVNLLGMTPQASQELWEERIPADVTKVSVGGDRSGVSQRSVEGQRSMASHHSARSADRDEMYGYGGQDTRTSRNSYDTKYEDKGDRNADFWATPQRSREPSRQGYHDDSKPMASRDVHVQMPQDEKGKFTFTEPAPPPGTDPTLQYQSRQPGGFRGSLAAEPRETTREGRPGARFQLYRPPGSPDVFYVPLAEDREPDTPVSQTTLESTHLGSDDAEPPTFPPSYLGTRKDTFEAIHSVGIYGTRKSPKYLSKLSKSQEGSPKDATEDRSSRKEDVDSHKGEMEKPGGASDGISEERVRAIIQQERRSLGGEEGVPSVLDREERSRVGDKREQAPYKERREEATRRKQTAADYREGQRDNKGSHLNDTRDRAAERPVLSPPRPREAWSREDSNERRRPRSTDASDIRDKPAASFIEYPPSLQSRSPPEQRDRSMEEDFKPLEPEPPSPPKGRGLTRSELDNQRREYQPRDRGVRGRYRSPTSDPYVESRRTELSPSRYRGYNDVSYGRDRTRDYVRGRPTNVRPPDVARYDRGGAVERTRADRSPIRDYVRRSPDRDRGVRTSPGSYPTASPGRHRERRPDRDSYRQEYDARRGMGTAGREYDVSTLRRSQNVLQEVLEQEERIEGMLEGRQNLDELWERFKEEVVSNMEDEENRLDPAQLEELADMMRDPLKFSLQQMYKDHVQRKAEQQGRGGTAGDTAPPEEGDRSCELRDAIKVKMKDIEQTEDHSVQAKDTRSETVKKVPKGSKVKQGPVGKYLELSSSATSDTLTEGDDTLTEDRLIPEDKPRKDKPAEKKSSRKADTAKPAKDEVHKRDKREAREPPREDASVSSLLDSINTERLTKIFGDLQSPGSSDVNSLASDSSSVSSVDSVRFFQVFGQSNPKLLDLAKKIQKQRDRHGKKREKSGLSYLSSGASTLTLSPVPETDRDLTDDTSPVSTASSDAGDGKKLTKKALYPKAQEVDSSPTDTDSSAPCQCKTKKQGKHKEGREERQERIKKYQETRLKESKKEKKTEDPFKKPAQPPQRKQKTTKQERKHSRKEKKNDFGAVFPSPVTASTPAPHGNKVTIGIQTTPTLNSSTDSYVSTPREINRATQTTPSLDSGSEVEVRRPRDRKKQKPDQTSYYESTPMPKSGAADRGRPVSRGDVSAINNPGGLAWFQPMAEGESFRRKSSSSSARDVPTEDKGPERRRRRSSSHDDKLVLSVPTNTPEPMSKDGGVQGGAAAPQYPVLFESVKKKREDRETKPKSAEKGEQKEAQSENARPGLAWYVPVAQDLPWRRPFQERQQYAQERQDQIVRWMDDLTPHRRADQPPRPLERLTLQEALKMRNPAFISKSRERVRRMELASSERRQEHEYEMERMRLFGEERRRLQATEPAPQSENLHRPKKRIITKKEMADRSKRMYEKLPEVQRKKAQERRQAAYKSNRIKAQIYKKKVLDNLRRKNGLDY